MLNDNNTITVSAANNAALSFTFNEQGERIDTHWKSEVDLPLPERQAIEENEAALYFNHEGVLDFAKCHASFIERSAEYAASNDLEGTLNKKREAELGPSPEPIKARAHKTKVKAANPYHIIKHHSDNADFLFPTQIAEVYEAWESGEGITLGLGVTVNKKSDGEAFPFPEIEAAYIYHKKLNEFNQANDVKALEAQNIEAWSNKWDAEQMAVLAPAFTVNDILTKTELVTDFLCAATVDGETGLERFVADSLKRDIKTLSATKGGA